MKPSTPGNQKPLPRLTYAGKYLVLRHVWNSSSKMLELPNIFCCRGEGQGLFVRMDWGLSPQPLEVPRGWHSL